MDLDDCSCDLALCSGGEKPIGACGCSQAAFAYFVVMVCNQRPKETLEVIFFK